MLKYFVLLILIRLVLQYLLLTYFVQNTQPITIVTTKHDKTKPGHTDLVEIDLKLITLPSEDSISHFDDTHFEYLDLLESPSIKKGIVTPEEFHSMLQKTKEDIYSKTDDMEKYRVLRAIVRDIADDHGWKKLRIDSTILLRRNDATPIHKDPTTGMSLWILLDDFVDRFTLAFEQDGIWTQPKSAHFGHAALFRGQFVQHGSFAYCAHPPCVTKERSALGIHLVIDDSEPKLQSQ